MVYALVSKTNEPKARVGSTPTLGTKIFFLTAVIKLVHTDCMAAKKHTGVLKNKDIVKYRIYGLLIVLGTIFVAAYALMIMQENKQWNDALKSGHFVVEEHR
jgi:hypothetical protein